MKCFVHVHPLFSSFSPWCEECVKTAARRVAQNGPSKSVVIYSRQKSTFPYVNNQSKNQPCKQNIVCLRQIRLNSSRAVSTTFLPQVRFVHTVIPRPIKPLLYKGQLVMNRRQLGSLARAFGKLLRIRYLVLTGAVGSGVAINQVCRILLNINISVFFAHKMFLALLWQERYDNYHLTFITERS